MLATSRSRILPPIPPVLRFAFLGVLLAALVFFTMVWQPSPPADDTISPLEPKVAVPQIDRTILAGALDGTRVQRLLLDVEPLRHLLAVAIDVGPSVAAALGMPQAQVPLDQLQADPDAWRGRWIWYEGVLEDLAGPHEGHPIDGYSMYEATVRLASGEHAMAAFSIPPGNEIRRGMWVRIEGFFMKLRDANYPADITAAPMLVGREIQRDYEDWGAVRNLDPTILAKVDDANFAPGEPVWHSLEEDQTEALWHLGAYVTDAASERTLADWRRIGTLNVPDTYEKFVGNQIARGTPMRVFGTLIRRSTIAAPPNPAGIRFWTVAWVQVREFGGRLIPIWVPKRVDDLPMRADLEVRAFYYRWFAYESIDSGRHRVPLFVAADLDTFRLEVDQTMRQLGIGLAAAASLLIALIWWAQRRAARQTMQHAREMDDRRRRRRERTAIDLARRQT